MEPITTTKKEEKASKKSTHASIRVGKAMGRQVKQTLEQIQKKYGKRISASALLACVLPKLAPEDIAALQEGSLSHKDRFEHDYVCYVAKHGKVSRDEYLGLVMSGRAHEEAENIEVTKTAQK